MCRVPYQLFPGTHRGLSLEFVQQSLVYSFHGVKQHPPARLSRVYMDRRQGLIPGLLLLCFCEDLGCTRNRHSVNLGSESFGNR